jgi:vancomycin permeability regulator SanA
MRSAISGLGTRIGGVAGGINRWLWRFRRRRSWKFVVAGSVAFFAISTAAIVWDGVTDDLQKADVALVMGAKVKTDGTPSHRLTARLDTAVDLFKLGHFEYLIVSGGLGWEGHDEAQIMGAYLVDHGVPEARIFIDSGGTDTYMTARNASRIMQANGMRSVLVITQYFHVPRTKLALKRFGVSPVYTANAAYWGLRDLLYIPREVVAYYYYLLRSYDQDVK